MAIHIYDVLYNEKIRLSSDERIKDTDFINVFQTISTVSKVLYKDASDRSKTDEMFEEEDLVSSLWSFLSIYFPGLETLKELTDGVIQKEGSSKPVRVNNAHLLHQFWIYAFGTLKHISQNEIV